MAEINNPQPPLGLPPGSVRALLSLMVVSMVIEETVHGHDLSVHLVEALLMVLALYFSARKIVSVPPAVLQQLEKEGQIPVERQPLYLPRFSIRLVILLSFAGAAAYLYQHDRLFTNPSLSSFGMVGAYLLGVLLRPMGRFLRRGEMAASLMDRFADLRALVVLGAVAVLTVSYWLDKPEWRPDWAQHAALTLLLYYFGAR
jgi:hypothetical protein